jgi:hypothetical protein
MTPSSKIILVFLTALLCVLPSFGQSEETKRELRSTFSHFEVVRPAKEQAQIGIADGYRFSFNLNGIRHILVVEPNDLLSSDYRAETTNAAGRVSISEPAAKTYKGHIEGQARSEVRLTIAGDRIEGFFDTSAGRFFVEPASRYSQAADSKDLVVYQADDHLNKDQFWCNSELPGKITEFRANVEMATVESVQVYRRIDLATDADQQFVSQNGGATATNSEILSILNMVEGTFKNELGLTIRVSYQHTWTTADPYASSSLSALLTSFQNHWNTNFSTVSYPRNAAHLFSGKTVSQSQGIAYMGAMCNNPAFAYGVSGYVGWAPGKFLVTAHELGHNLNATHAEAAQSCSNTLMNSVLSGNTPLSFCQFSQNEVQGFVLGMGGQCLAYVRKANFDFDGDGRSDISVFRPSNGAWYLNTSTQGFNAFQFGMIGDKVVAADYDGDGKADAAIYRNGVWWRYLSATGTIDAVSFGLPDDIPQPVDLDGDGKADVAVYRPSTGQWFWLASSTGAFNAVQFGAPGDIPAAGDFTGNGRAELVVFRPSNGVWYRYSVSSGAFDAVQFGMVGDVPVSADYDGDGKLDVAVWRPSNGVWYVLRSSNGSFSGVSFGLPTDIPAPADFDGDGKADITVFRPSEGTWYRLNSSNGAFSAFQFGSPGDRPIPAR